MKKLFYVAIVALFAASCQEEIQVPEPAKTDNEPVTGVWYDGKVIGTRAVYTPPEVIIQLARSGLPFYIKSAYASHPYPYLSVTKKNDNITTWNVDDGSYRQRWIIKGENSGDQTIHVVGGINNPEIKAISFDGSQIKLKEKEFFLGGLNILQYKSPYRLYPLGEENEYYFRGYDITNFGMKTLSLKNYISNDVQAEGLPNNFTVLQKWKITPLEEFEIIDVSYNMVTGDTFKMMPTSVMQYNVRNNGPSIYYYADKISMTKTTESTFSETKKLSVSLKVSQNFKVGVPLISQGEMNIEQTTSKDYTWSTSNKETITESIERNISYEIPPYTTINITTMGYRYEVDITYYAKVRGIQSGTILYLPGRWEGVTVESTDVDIQEII